MIIDCDSCLVREIACHDCVVSAILSPGPQNGIDQFGINQYGIDEAEQTAIALLASRGLVPPLRFGENSRSRAESRQGLG